MQEKLRVEGKFGDARELHVDSLGVLGRRKMQENLPRIPLDLWGDGDPRGSTRILLCVSASEASAFVVIQEKSTRILFELSKV
jgi:hypothetical protein